MLRLAVLLFGIGWLIAESSEQARASPQDEAASDVVDASDALVAGLKQSMTRKERKEFDRQVRINIANELQSDAIACGTSISFTNAELPKEAEIWIDQSATEDQIACVQKRIPDAKRAGSLTTP